MNPLRRRRSIAAAVGCVTLFGAALVLEARQPEKCRFESAATNLSVRATSERIDIVGIVSASDDYDIENYAVRARLRKVCVSTTRLTTAPPLRPRPFLETLATLRSPETVLALWGGGGVTLIGVLTQATLTGLQLSASADPRFPVDALGVTLLP